MHVLLSFFLVFVTTTFAFAGGFTSVGGNGGGGVRFSDATSCPTNVTTAVFLNQCVDRDDGTEWTCTNPALGGASAVLCDSPGDWVNSSSSSSSGVSTFESRAGVVVSVAGDYTATEITNAPAGAIAAITVQAAITELDTEKSDTAHTHTSTTISALDISADTNLAVTAPLVLTDDTLSLSATVDLGASTSFEVPNSANPTTNVFGQLAGDSDAWGASRGALEFFDGTASVWFPGILMSDVCTNGQVPKFNTGGTWTCEDDATVTAIGTGVLRVDAGIQSTAELSGDVTTAGSNVTVVANDSHTHGTSTIAGLDISDDTNLAVTAPVVLTGDTLSLAAVLDFGASTSFEVPNAAAPTTNIFGQLAGDNNAWGASRGALQFFDGTANVFLPGILASDTCLNGEIPKFNTGGTWTCEADATTAASGTGVLRVDAGVQSTAELSGDATTTGSNVVTVVDDLHAHTTTSISGLDISSDTNLAVTTPIVLSGDTLSLSATVDLGAGTSFEVPNSTNPTTNVFGQLAGDSDAWGTSRGALEFFDGTASVWFPGILMSDVCLDNEIPKFHTGGTWTCEADQGSGTVANLTTGTIPKAASASSLNDSAIIQDADSVNFSLPIEGPASATPRLELIDSDTADDEVNVRLSATATVFTTAIEDVDVALEQYVDGSMKNVLTSVADGALTIGAATDTMSITLASINTGTAALVLPLQSVAGAEILNDTLTATQIDETGAFTWTGYHNFVAGQLRAPESAIAALPTGGAHTGKIYVVTDALTAGSCTINGGSAKSICRYSGSAWESIGGGAGGGGGVSSFAADSQRFNVATATTTPVLSTKAQNALGSIATTATVNWANGVVQTATLTGDVTLSFANPVNGQRYILVLTQNTPGGWDVTWPTITWMHPGTPPPMPTDAGAAAWFEFTYDGTAYTAVSPRQTEYAILATNCTVEIIPAGGWCMQTTAPYPFYHCPLAPNTVCDAVGEAIISPTVEDVITATNRGLNDAATIQRYISGAVSEATAVIAFCNDVAPINGCTGAEDSGVKGWSDPVTGPQWKFFPDQDSDTSIPTGKTWILRSVQLGVLETIDGATGVHTYSVNGAPRKSVEPLARPFGVCTRSEAALDTSKPIIGYITCTSATTDGFDFDWVMPDSWGMGVVPNTVTVEVAAISVNAAPANSLVLICSGQSVRSGDTVTTRSATGAQTLTLTFAANDREQHATTPAITLQGTVGAGAHVYMHCDVQSATATMADVRIHAMPKVEYFIGSRGD